MICRKVLCLTVLLVVLKTSSQSPVKSEENVDINLDIECISNATCMKSASNKIVRALKLKKPLNFGGAFTVEPLKNVKIDEGRSFNKLWDIVTSNSVRIPIGAYSLSLQRSEEHENYFEINVSKTVEGDEKF
jgi:hypothetical protein